MNLWRKGHAPRRVVAPARNAAVSPQSFPIYDMAGFLHTLAVGSVTAMLRQGFVTGRGHRGI
jgi:hypothetical protein